jgi:biotin carboxyl carrier protein
MKVKLKLGDQVEEVELIRQGDRLQVTRAGQTTTLRLLDRQGTVFLLAQEDGRGRRHLAVAGHTDGDRRQMWVNGRTFTYERLRERQGADVTADTAAALLSATIPAVVSQVLVQVGDTVAAGDKLILLESMKMIMPIQAPYAGQVRAVHCAAGDAVQPGVQLLEVEPAAAASS